MAQACFCPRNGKIHTKGRPGRVLIDEKSRDEIERRCREDEGRISKFSSEGQSLSTHMSELLMPHHAVINGKKPAKGVKLTYKMFANV